MADLTDLGGKAVGLCGVDGNMIQVHKQNEELGYVGYIDTIDTSIIHDVISRGYIPVISSIGMGADGKTYNINADTVAAKIAGALKAETMVAMTNIDGVLRDVHDPDSLISKITMAGGRSVKSGWCHCRRYDSKGRLLLRSHRSWGTKGIYHQW